ncbi:MAG: Fur family transcriptional regulator [Litoreibacter sp.]|uniref:Fur family transcriptional regulator n=1 Tax=Litoreibacter sp. TaxID=1969459 RepID=UPI00329747AB
MGSFGFKPHDHSSCISTGVSEVAKRCEAAGLQFTPVRKRVLEILLEGHRAIGAYEILDKLREEGLGSQPPVAYRALDFLVKHRFAHKIEKLNAFIACTHPGDMHAPAFLICRSCDAVEEALTAGEDGRLDKAAQETGFTIERTVLEAEGVCPNCQGKSE